VEYDFVHWLANDNGQGVHITILTMLLLGGLGFPVPEDIPLILGGVAASQGLVSFRAVFLTCYVGVLLADQVIYLFGYYFGQRLLNAGTRSPFFPSITEDRVDSIRDGLRKKRLIYIVLGRHFFPLRTATFLIAGTLAIPYMEFLVADAFAALLSVTLVLWLGYLLGGQLTPEVISHLVHESHYYIFAFTLVGIVMYLVTRRIKKRKLQSAKKDVVNEQSLSSN
jgi:membrane protein DedA with SNARE-associated domain